MDNKENTLAALDALRAAIENQSGDIDVEKIEQIAGSLMDKKFAAALPALLDQCGKIATGAAGESVAAVRAELAEVRAAAASAVRPVRVEAAADRPAVDLGVQHKNVETLFKLCQVCDGSGNHLNIYLFGPAGTGKTTAAESVARGLYGDDWASKYHANGAVNSAYDLLGYCDANGNYHETEFYRAYKNGGIYLFDELDSSSPAAVLAFNQALANGRCAFPCGMVQRHRDCIIIAGGNTCMRGDGAGSGFQRVRHDAAFRDRFTFLEWPIDENLERTIACSYGDVGRSWCERVQKMRANAAAAGIRDFEITPRATFRGCAQLAQGVPEAVVIAGEIRKGLPAAQWEKVKA